MALEQWSDDIWIDRLSDRPGLTEDLDLLADRYARTDGPPHLILDLGLVRSLTSRHLGALDRKSVV